MIESWTVSMKQVKKMHREMTLGNWALGGDLTRYVYHSMSEFFPHAIIRRTGDISILHQNLRDDVGALPVDTRLGRMSLQDYVQRDGVDGVLVLSQGKIVFEKYPRMRPTDKHLFMSVTKCFIGMIVAILEERGLVNPTETVETYLPELCDSGWHGVPVMDLLDMASGIDCDEHIVGAYTDPDNNHYRYESALGWLPLTQSTPASVYGHMQALGRKRSPGEAFDYASANTFVLGWLSERVTGKPLNEIIATEFWKKTGAESDALMAISNREWAPISHGGMSSTLRDLARYGLLFTPSYSLVADQPVISNQILQRIRSGGRPQLFMNGLTGERFLAHLGGEMPRHNTYQWDLVMDDGDFFKGGFGGQGLYLSPSRDLVVAFFGTPLEVNGESNEMLRVARQLAGSGLLS